MSRRRTLSDSDSSDDEAEVVNFKRARKTSDINPPELPSNKPGPGASNNSQLKRPPQPPCPVGNVNTGRNLLLSNGFVHGRRYIDRDGVDGNGDAVVPPGRSLANPSAMKAVIDLEKRNPAIPPAEAAAAPRCVPPVHGPLFVRPRPPASLNGHGGGGLVQKKVDIPPEKTELTPSQIMTVMGFTKGRGLAKYLAEIKPPDRLFSIDDFEEKVDALGISLADMELITINDVELNEEIKWISCPNTPILRLETLIEGRKVGPVITSIEIDKENAFIDPWLYTELIECKKLYIDMGQIRYQIVRSRSNLFERIGSGPFMCRAAMKIANLDAILDNELTQPKTPKGTLAVGPNGLLYFADVCAGPGGFTEYILWKKKWEAKGFGFTLKGDLDFDILNFKAEPETFEAYYGEAGDGNVYNPANVNGYIKHVLESTGGSGVHLMMADGGFAVSKQEFLQEVLSHQIVLSQIFVALAIVRVGGYFLCKLFDAVTPFTVALIYLVYHCFDCVTIHKPLTSRPANSERYLICKWKKPKEVTAPITSYLADCHQLLWKLMNENVDAESKTSILELVPTSILTDLSRVPFYIHMRDSNNRLAKKQIETLKRMVAFVRDECLTTEVAQVRAKTKALNHWKIPEKIPIPANIRTADSACKDILLELPLTMLRHVEKILVPRNAELLFKSAYDWRFVFVYAATVENPNRGFYMSLGQNLVYRYDGSQWVIIAQREPLLELPSKTLLYGEFVHEIYGRSATDQTLIMAFHIIDALQLGGVDLRNIHYIQRMEMCVKFAKAVTKPGTLPVHAKTPIRMENLADFVGKLENRVVKGFGVGAKLVCPLDMADPYAPFAIPNGLLFLKITKEPWQMALNRQTHKKYFFNTATGATSEKVPGDAISGFFHTMGSRVWWPWDNETNVIVPTFPPNDPRIATLSPNRLHTCNMLAFINYTIRQVPSVSPPRTTLYVGSQSDKVVAKEDGTNTK